MRGIGDVGGGDGRAVGVVVGGNIKGIWDWVHGLF